jgi:plastocyanin
MIRRALAISCLFALVGIAAVASTNVRAHADDAKLQTVSVTIHNFSFNPKEITVAKGTRVTWTNRDDVPHTVTSSQQKFRSKAPDTGDQFSFTFNESEAYAYFCSVHPMMTGKVIVQ